MVLVAQMGVIEGGWTYIWAAYVVTWVFLSGYACTLWLRRPSGAPRDEDEA